MKTLIPKLTPALVLGLLPFAALAQQGVSVTDGYARGANPKSGAAFMVIRNDGATSCTLTGVATDIADKADLHTSREEDGMMRMVRMEPVEIPPSGSHELARGGDHVMMMGLKQPLEDGQQVALTLDLGDCGSLEVSVPVDNKRMPGQGG